MEQVLGKALLAILISSPSGTALQQLQGSWSAAIRRGSFPRGQRCSRRRFLEDTGSKPRCFRQRRGIESIGFRGGRGAACSGLRLQRRIHGSDVSHGRFPGPPTATSTRGWVTVTDSCGHVRVLRCFRQVLASFALFRDRKWD
ncbi:unnamed protein product [Symbiodinium sp. CCMP2456]|nr:unnamed protein product [Symbiodinium sp. CCMP2456]